MPNLMRRIAGIAGAAVLIAACGPGASPAPTAGSLPTAAAGSSAGGGGAGTVAVTEVDGKITPATTTAAAGPVTFTITNNGTQTHEFVVIKTDLADDKLPTTADGNEVDETATGVTVVDEVEEVAVGTPATLNVTLQPGNYVFICNIPTHYGLGMHVAFTVQ